MTTDPNGPDKTLDDTLEELSTSLTAILGYAQILVRANLPPENKTDVHALCAEVKHSYLRLQELRTMLQQNDSLESKSPAPVEQTGTNGREEHILVVDDESSIRHVLGRFLDLQGYKVTLAASVDQAIKNLGEQSFNLILSDHKMPQKNGEELYRFVKENHPDLIGKFVLITASGADASARRFIEETDVRVIEKPFELSKLGVTVGALLKT